MILPGKSGKVDSDLTLRNVVFCKDSTTWQANEPQLRIRRPEVQIEQGASEE
jgi:hypothetical protein